MMVVALAMIGLRWVRRRFGLTQYVLLAAQTASTPYAVPQRVRGHALRDSRSLGGGADNAAELPGRQRFDRAAAGEQQPPGSSRLRRRPSRHQARSSSTSCGDSVAVLAPLPRSSMRSESISPTLSATTSETRSPAP